MATTPYTSSRLTTPITPGYYWQAGGSTWVMPDYENDQLHVIVHDEDTIDQYRILTWDLTSAGAHTHDVALDLTDVGEDISGYYFNGGIIAPTKIQGTNVMVGTIVYYPEFEEHVNSLRWRTVTWNVLTGAIIDHELLSGNPRVDLFDLTTVPTAHATWMVPIGSSNYLRLFSYVPQDTTLPSNVQETVGYISLISNAGAITHLISGLEYEDIAPHTLNWSLTRGRQISDTVSSYYVFSRYEVYEIQVPIDAASADDLTSTLIYTPDPVEFQFDFLEVVAEGSTWMEGQGSPDSIIYSAGITEVYWSECTGKLLVMVNPYDFSDPLELSAHIVVLGYDEDDDEYNVIRVDDFGINRGGFSTAWHTGSTNLSTMIEDRNSQVPGTIGIYGIDLNYADRFVMYVIENGQTEVRENTLANIEVDYENMYSLHFDANNDFFIIHEPYSLDDVTKLVKRDSNLFFSGQELCDISNADFVSGDAKISFAEEKDPNNVDWASLSFDEEYDSFFISGYKVHAEMKKWNPMYIYIVSKTEDGSGFFVQGLWDYSDDPISNRWSTNQAGYLESQRGYIDRPGRAYTYTRLKLRGSGPVLQIKITSDDNKPFNIAGWSSFETANQMP